MGSGKKRSFYGQAEHRGVKEPYSNAIIGAKFSRLLTVRMGGGLPSYRQPDRKNIVFFPDHSPLRKYEKKLPFFDYIAIMNATLKVSGFLI